MNKLFTKIAAAGLSLAMAVGVGVAVGSAKKGAAPVEAAQGDKVTKTLTFTSNFYGISTTQGNQTLTGDGATYGFEFVKGSGTGAKASGGTPSSTSYVLFGKSGVYFRNTSAPANSYISAISWTYSSGVSTNVVLGIGYGESALNASASVTNQPKASQNGTVSLTPTDTSKSYFIVKVTNAYNCQWKSFSVTWTEKAPASKPLTDIALSGTGIDTSGAPAYELEINASDSTAHTVNVGLTPTDATDQKVNITSTGGTSGLITKSTSQVTCSSGSGSFTVTSKGDAGYEVLTLAGNTQTSVQAYLTVTVLDDSKTYYSVSYTGLHGSLSNTTSVEEGDPLDTYLVPDTHYHLPTTITVTAGGSTLIAGTDYDYNNSTGEIQILEVNGDIVVSTSCVEDSKYTITYVPGDHGTGSNYVVNNVYAGSYTLTTFATAGFTASSGYAFKKWSVGGTEYAEGASITVSANTTVTAVYDEVTTYTILTDATSLKEDTTFVLVYETSGSYRVSSNITSNHVVLSETTSATTISGVTAGSTLVSTEAMVFTLKGSSGAWKIKSGDQYLKFTGTSNGNDAFDTEANASTFSASIKDNKYILFTCTSATGNGRVWRMNTSSHDMRNYATSSGVGDVYMFANIPSSQDPCSVSYTGSNGSLSSTADVEKGDPLNVTLIPDTHYHLPTSITVVMDEVELVAGTDYTYNSGTGAISISEVTGDVVISTSCVEDDKFTVTYSAGTNGTGSHAESNVYVGTYTLLAFDSLTGVSANSGYRFKNYTVSGVEKDPGDTFTLSANTTVTVNFEVQPSETTVTTQISAYASSHSWQNATQYSTINMDSNIAVVASGGDNTGKYYSSGGQWRIYQSENPSITFTAASGYDMVSITITYSADNDGVLLDEDSNQISSGTAVSLDNVTEYTFGVGKTSSGTNGQIRITEIEVVYDISSAETYTITYNANGGSGTMSPTTGVSPAVAACEYTYSGHAFERWNTQADGEGDDYAVGTHMSEDITLYAIWQEHIEPIGGHVTMTGVSSATSVTVNGHAGIKCGTGNKGGSMTLTLEEANITKIKVYVAGWSSDTTTVNVSIDNGTISESSLELTSDSNISGSTTSFTLDGAETLYVFTLDITNAPADSVITLSTSTGNKRFVVWGATDLFAETFAQEFWDNVICDSTGAIQPTFTQGYSWSTFEALYDGLDAQEQGRLQDANGNQLSSNLIEKAMGRYDYIEGKYNPEGSSSSPWKNFIGRTITPVGNGRVLISSIIGDSSNITAIIVIVSLVSLTAIGGYFAIRKRKEQ